MVADFRFLHAADIHLDSPLHGLSRYEGLPIDEIRSATRAAFDNLIRHAIDEAIDFVVIAGDLFDGDWRDMGTGLYFARAMARLNQAGIPAFVLAGNHDAASSSRGPFLGRPMSVSSAADGPRRITYPGFRSPSMARASRPRRSPTTSSSAIPPPSRTVSTSGCYIPLWRAGTAMRTTHPAASMTCGPAVTTTGRLLILLGQRLREAANAPWSEFDFEAGDWFLPRARTKADRDHLVPMSEQAIELLEDLEPNPNKRVGPAFTTNDKVGISGFSKLKVQIGEEIERLLSESEKARELVPNGIAGWVIHDLRRSHATGCQGMGIDLTHSEAILNHAFGRTLSGVAPVYHVHDYYDDKAEALARWGELIERAVELFHAGDLDGIRALDPARRTARRRRRGDGQEV